MNGFISLISRHQWTSAEMPLNATSYLTARGWKGTGIPLDGQQGRGLKKPLALPMKRNMKGLGKERDRAVEWWDCIFEAGAKKLTSNKEASTEEGKNHVEEVGISTTDKLSLETQAKRAFARKMLMTGFVRGSPDDKYVEKQKELERILLQQQKEREESQKIAGKNEVVTNTLTQDKSSKRDENKKRKKDMKSADKGTIKHDKSKSSHPTTVKSKKSRDDVVVKEKGRNKAMQREQGGSEEDKQKKKAKRSKEKEKKAKKSKEKVRRKKDIESEGGQEESLKRKKEKSVSKNEKAHKRRRTRSPSLS